MKSLKQVCAVAGFVLAVCLPTGYALAFDEEAYVALGKETTKQIGEMLKGPVKDGVPSVIKNLRGMIEVGVAGCREYMQNKPGGDPLLSLVIERTEEMSNLSSDEMRRQWYAGELPRLFGIEMEGQDHFLASINLMDSVVHPSAAIILINRYQQSGNPADLKRARYELIEAIEHVARIQK